jgi:hypothetical protein
MSNPDHTNSLELSQSLQTYLQAFYAADVAEANAYRPFVVKADVIFPDWRGDWKQVVYGYSHADVEQRVEQALGWALNYIWTIYDAETGE